MRKNDSVAICLLWTIASVLSSCVSKTDELDLDKKLRLDMSVASEGLSVPLGSLEKIYIDSIIPIDEDDPDATLKRLDNGVYGIALDGNIDKVSVDIDEITVNIANPSIDPILTHFDNPTPDDIQIARVDKHTSFNMDQVDMESINSSLPSIESAQDNDPIQVQGLPEVLSYTYMTKTFELNVKDNKEIQIQPDGTNTAFSYYLGAPVNNTVEIPAGIYTVPRVSAEVSIPEQTAPCSFVYNDFPSDVDKINTIEFGPKGSANGQLVSFVMNLADVDAIMHYPGYVIEELEVTFPSEFVLAKDANCQYPCTVNGNVFTINDACLRDSTEMVDETNPTKVEFSFYLKEMKLDRGTDEPTGSVMTYDGEIKYKAKLRIGGIPHLIGMADIKTNMNVDTKLSLKDLSVNTKEKAIELPAGSIHSDFEVTGLDDVSRVNAIQFDSENSAISMSISDLDIAPFALDDKSVISVTFDEKYKFDTSVCNDENGDKVGEWTEESGKQTINLDGSAIGKTFQLKLSSLEINQDVNGGSLSLSNDISYGGQLYIAPKTNLKLSDLSVLDDKSCDISVWGNMSVENADVVTAVITSEMKDSTEIDVDEKVDNALVLLERVDLADPAQIGFKLKFNGIPTSIEEIDLDNFKLLFPDFIELAYTGKDKRIKLNDNLLTIDGSLVKSELADDGTGFILEGLYINGLKFKDNPVRKADDGNTYITLKDQKVLFDGAVKVSNQSVNSNELADITVIPTVTISPIKVQSVCGKVNPEIDPVNESIAVDLGEDLDFLKEDGNRITLNNPEFAINLTTTIPLPVCMDITISSVLNGDFVAQNVKPDLGTVTIPACPLSDDKKDVCLLFYCNDRVTSQSDDTVFVKISKFPDLMSQIPDSIYFNMDASVNQSESYTIDLTRELSVMGGYNVSIPLSFNDMLITYSDTIKDLGKDLKDIADMSVSFACNISAKIESTIPLGLSVSAIPLDCDMNPISDLKFSDFSIEAGAKDNPVVSDMHIALEMTDQALDKLDAVRFVISCNSGSDTHGNVIDSSEYIQIRDIVLDFPQGINIDLTE